MSNHANLNNIELQIVPFHIMRELKALQKCYIYSSAWDISCNHNIIIRIMWGVMGHLRAFHCREATDEVEE